MIRAATDLTSEERAKVANLLYGVGDSDIEAIDAEGAQLAGQRAEEIESGAVRALPREEADRYLDAWLNKRSS